MGYVTLIVYKPREGQLIPLVEHLKTGFQILVRKQLVCEQPLLIMESKQGYVMLLVEWRSEDSDAGTASDPEVQDIWMKVSKLADFVRPGDVKELNEMFPKFSTLYKS